MLKNDSTATVKRRLLHNDKCLICKTSIKDYQDFQYMIFPYGNKKVYRFFHTFCLLQNDYADGPTIEGRVING